MRIHTLQQLESMFQEMGLSTRGQSTGYDLPKEQSPKPAGGALQVFIVLSDSTREEEGVNA